ncbi:MAG: hypothetical protein HUU21_20305, partial [Polyangiaceae bacterium]|nr:hypothetical protein [Polyangiaceae bacterium]
KAAAEPQAAPAPEPLPARTSATFEKMSRISVYLAIGVFLLNMACAWWVAGVSNWLIGKPLIGGDTTAVAKALEQAPQASANMHVFLNRLLEAEIQLRTVQNRQTISIVAISSGFALVAIGFALFIMGAEGAFNVKGNVGDRGNLVVKSTAPGLLCFVLAAVIVCSSLAGTAQVASSPFTIYPDGPMSPGANAAPLGAPPVVLPPAAALPPVPIPLAGAEGSPPITPKATSQPAGLRPRPTASPTGGALGPGFQPPPLPQE